MCPQTTSISGITSKAAASESTCTTSTSSATCRISSINSSVKSICIKTFIFLSFPCDCPSSATDPIICLFQFHQQRKQVMQNHIVKTHPDGTVLPREEQLAWKLAQLAARNQAADADVVEMIGNRVIDNAAVALAAINRPPVRNARLLALGYPHPHNSGARLFGVANDRSFHCEWAGLGQRRSRARTRHARHLPRGRLLASRRQHPRPARRCPANGGRRSCADLGHTHGLRGTDGAGDGHLLARAQDRPRRPPRPSRGRRARDQCSRCQPSKSTKRSTRACT